MNDPILQWIRVGLVFLAVTAFAALFAAAITQVWQASNGKPPQYTEPYLYVATGLAALVGGIFAVAFGVKQATTDSKSQSLVGHNLRALGSLPNVPPNAATVLGGIYAFAYVALGIAAMTTWVLHPNEISDLVKNLGTTFLGLATPIVAAFFQPAP
jgi:hypothetical protein